MGGIEGIGWKRGERRKAISELGSFPLKPLNKMCTVLCVCVCMQVYLYAFVRYPPLSQVTTQSAWLEVHYIVESHKSSTFKVILFSTVYLKTSELTSTTALMQYPSSSHLCFYVTSSKNVNEIRKKYYI